MVQTSKIKKHHLSDEEREKALAMMDLLKSQNEPNAIKIKKTAEHFGVSHTTVYRLLKSRRRRKKRRDAGTKKHIVSAQLREEFGEIYIGDQQRSVNNALKLLRQKHKDIYIPYRYANEWAKKIKEAGIPKTYTSLKAPEPIGSYPHARRVGNFLFLSGIGPREWGAKKIPGVELDTNGNIVSYDIEAQCRSVFNNVKLILEDAGSSWDKIVDVTVFLTDMKKDFATFNRVYGEYFKDNQPCRTTVEVNALPTPIAIELKVIATIVDSR